MYSEDLRRRMEVALASDGARNELFSSAFATFGTVYYVDADNGSDTRNDGLSMSGAFATVAKAYSKVTSNAHDVIVLSGAGAHTLTDELLVAKNRVHFVGLGGGSRYMGQRTRFEMGVTTGSAIALLQVTGVGCTFSNIKFRSSDTLATSLYCVADGGEFTQFTNCSFEKATDLGTALSAEFLCNSDTGYYKNCTFGNLIYARTHATRSVVYFARETITGKVARDCMFEDCLFLNHCGTAAQVHFYIPGATDIERLLLFKNCTFWTAKLSAATQAAVFGVTSAQTEGEVLLQGCVTQNVTDTCVTGKGVFTNSVTPVSDGTESVTCAAT